MLYIICCASVEIGWFVTSGGGVSHNVPCVYEVQYTLLFLMYFNQLCKIKRTEFCSKNQSAWPNSHLFQISECLLCLSQSHGSVIKTSINHIPRTSLNYVLFSFQIPIVNHPDSSDTHNIAEVLNAACCRQPKASCKREIKPPYINNMYRLISRLSL